MKYRKEFREANGRLKTLDEETLNDALNKMSFDELVEHRDYIIQQELGEEKQLSEEKEQEQINKLLQMTREPSADERKPIKVHSHRTAKRILILAAAILILISAFMVAAVASKRDFSILNGVVKFDDGKIYVRFPKEEASTAMTVAELKADLHEHGFENVKLPGCFDTGVWQVKNVTYEADDNLVKARLNVENKDESYMIGIFLHLESGFPRDTMFYGAESGETIQNGDISLYVIDHGEGRCELIYFTDNIEYSIYSVSSIGHMRAVAETVV